MGTKHRGREYYVPPDDIKRLPVGRVLLVEKTRTASRSSTSCRPTRTTDGKEGAGYSSLPARGGR